MFLGMPIRTMRSCLMKRPGNKRSHESVPLKDPPVYRKVQNLKFQEI
jgi:hypothetical protein